MGYTPIASTESGCHEDDLLIIDTAYGTQESTEGTYDHKEIIDKLVRLISQCDTECRGFITPGQYKTSWDIRMRSIAILANAASKLANDTDKVKIYDS
jgi:hypothetical protein